MGKFDGISGIAPLELLGRPLRSAQEIYHLIWTVVALSVVLLQNLLNSRPGRAIRALKGGVVMAGPWARTAWSKGCLLPHCRCAGQRVRLAVCAYATFGQPNPVWSERWHRIPVHGGHWWVPVRCGAPSWAPGLVLLLGTSCRPCCHACLARPKFETIVLGLLLVALLQYAQSGLWPLLVGLVPERWRRQLAPLPTLRYRGIAAARTSWRGRDAVEVDGARKGVWRLVAVNDMRFDVRAGEVMGLIGPNGAGKSTMFNLISGVLQVTRGAVRYRGQEIQNLPSREIVQRGVARTFQHVKLFGHMSVLENVAWVRTCAARPGCCAACCA